MPATRPRSYRAHRTSDRWLDETGAISAAGTQPTGAVVIVYQRGGAIVGPVALHRNGSVVQTADRTAGRAWRTPVDVSAGQPGTHAGGADLAIDSRGDAVAAWLLTLPSPGEDDKPPVMCWALRSAAGRGSPRSLRRADMVHGAVGVAVDPCGDIAAIRPRLGSGGYIIVRATVP